MSCAPCSRTRLRPRQHPRPLRGRHPRHGPLRPIRRNRKEPRRLLRGLGVERGPSDSPPQGATHGPTPAYSVAHLPGRGSDHALLPHRRCLRSAQPTRQTLRISLKQLSDPEVIALALLQQLRGVESERSFLREAQRLFSHLFPGVVGLLHPSSFNRRVRKLRRFLEPLRREILPELVGEPETLISSILRCWKSSIPGKSGSRRAWRERHG